MLLSYTLSLVASFAVASAQLKGFNYGSSFTDGTAKTLSDFTAEFNAAKSLPGTNGFTSARLYTMIQFGTQNTPISAIQAAIDTDTSLLLGLWASGGQEGLDNEISALTAAISQYGEEFTSRVVGISVGSEDLYRISVIGVASEAGIGAGPDVVVNFINQVRQAISSTELSGAKITHVDTYNSWTNGSNAAVIDAVDFICMDAYPYFQKEFANGIENGRSLFVSAYDETVAVAQGKDIWVTETGFPVSGETINAAVPSIANAKTFWDDVGCGFLFGQINTYWYVLQDAAPTTPSPSFGLIPSGPVSGTPLYDLSCPVNAQSSSSSSSTSSVVTGGPNVLVAPSPSSTVASGSSSSSVAPIATTSSAEEAEDSSTPVSTSETSSSSSRAAMSTLVGSSSATIAAAATVAATNGTQTTVTTQQSSSATTAASVPTVGISNSGSGLSGNQLMMGAVAVAAFFATL